MRDALDEFTARDIKVLIVEPQFDGHGAAAISNPQTAVQNGGSGKQRCRHGQERFGNRTENG
jgi:hypothetical protein